jgi:N-acetyl-anhydromuramyl-L-alanine amidase AmpD
MKTTAKHYTPGFGKRKPIRMIVLHSAENQELAGQANHLVAWFAGDAAPQASAHYMIDDKVIAQSVDDKDIAWATDVWERNIESISIEMSGHADQTAAQWADKYSKSVIANTVKLCKDLAIKYKIPPVQLTLSQILDGKTKGYCTHAQITQAHKIVGGHMDPGINFPISDFLKAVSK